MSVTNLQSPRSGKPVPNQFEIRVRDRIIFKSYEKIIAIHNSSTGETLMNKDYWDTSATTLKYFKVWLGTSQNKSNLYRYILDNVNYRLVGDALITETYYGLMA